MLWATETKHPLEHDQVVHLYYRCGAVFDEIFRNTREGLHFTSVRDPSV